MRVMSAFLIAGLLAGACQKADKDKKESASASTSAGFMSGLFEIINDRSKTCLEIGTGLADFEKQHAGEIDALTADWKAAAGDPARRTALEKPIASGRPAVNRLRARC